MGGLVEAETCRRDIINDKRIFVMDCANCWVKCCLLILRQNLCPHEAIAEVRRFLQCDE
jgi:hypothetical protein